MSDIEHVCRKLFKLEAKVQKIQVAANQRVLAAGGRVRIAEADATHWRAQHKIATDTIVRLKKEDV